MEEHVMEHFKNIVSNDCSSPSSPIIREVIPKTVYAADNMVLLQMPSMSDVKEALFNLCPTSSLSLMDL